MLVSQGLDSRGLVVVFGAYALSDGVLALIMALSVRGVAGFGSLLVCHVRSGQSYPSPARGPWHLSTLNRFPSP